MGRRCWFVAATLIPFATMIGQTPAAVHPPTIPMSVLGKHVLKHVDAPYPPGAKAARVTGDVLVGVEIDEKGKLTQEVVLGGPELLRASALNTIKQWTFSPIEIDGKPAVVRSAIRIQYGINSVEGYRP